MVKVTVTIVSPVGTLPSVRTIFVLPSPIGVLLHKIWYGPSTVRAPPSIVIEAVEPTSPELPIAPLTVEEQVPSPQPSAVTALGTSARATSKSRQR
jgi:hypothetical protein